MARLGMLAAVLLVAGALGAEDAVAQAKCRFVRIVEWPVRIVENKILVDGAINGQAVGIVLDTGATLSLILRSTAQRLDLPRREARGMRMFGWGGETKVEIASVDDFRLGEVSTRDVELYVAGETAVGRSADVLLGENFLRNFDVEFDLAHGAVRLFRPSDCDGVSLAYWTKETAGEVEMERVRDAQPRIAFTVRINDRAVDAFLDSGAASSYMSAEDAAAAGVTTGTQGVMPSGALRGLGGGPPIALWAGTFASFAIGNESIPDIRIRFGDLYKDQRYGSTGSRVPRNLAPTQPMVIGADFLRAHRLLVSHSQRRLYFTYTGGPVFEARTARPSAAAKGAPRSTLE